MADNTEDADVVDETSRSFEYRLPEMRRSCRSHGPIFAKERKGTTDGNITLLSLV